MIEGLKLKTNTTINQENITKSKKYNNPKNHIQKIKEREKKYDKEEKNFLNAKEFWWLSKKQAFEKLKKILTINKLTEIAKKHKENPYYIDSDLVNSWATYFYIEFLSQKENKKLLNIVVENGLWDIIGVCPSEKDIQKLKNIYKQDKINNIKKILNWYTTPYWKPLNINNIFSTNKCDPIISINKLKQLIDKNWNPISSEIIKQVLWSIWKVKILNNKDIIKNTFFKKNEIWYNKFIKEISKLGYNFTQLTKDKQNNIIKQISKEVDLNLSKDQVNILRKESLNIINANNIENIYKNINASISNLNKKTNKHQTIDNFSSQDLDASFRTKDLQWFYEKPFEEEKYAWKYILDWAVNKNFITKNSWLYKKLNKVLTKHDLSDTSTAQLAEKTINYIENSSFLKHIIPDKVINFLKKVSNNARETEYFFKTRKLIDTDNIWLYNNKAEELNIYNWEKAPNTLWHNQITTRKNFIKVFKNTDIKKINSNWLIDYFYKTKIKYWNWNDAIWVIYSDLWDKKFKEIKEFAESNKNLKWRFNAFLKKNKDIVNIMSNFHWFQKKWKDLENDIQTAEKYLNSNKNPITTFVAKQFIKINKWKIPNITAVANLTWELLKNPKKQTFYKSMISKALVNWFKSKEKLWKLKEITKRLWEKWIIFKKIIDISQKYNIEIKEGQAKEIVNKYINWWLDLKILINNINTFFPQAKNLSPKKYKQFVLDIIDGIDNWLSNNLKKEYELLDELKKTANPEKKEQIAKQLNNLLKNNPSLVKITIKVFKKNNDPKFKKILTYLENIGDNKTTYKDLSKALSSTSFKEGISRLKDTANYIKNLKDKQVTVIKKTNAEELKKKWSQAIDETLKNNKELAQEYYSTMYNSIFIDENKKQQIKEQAEKDWINLDNNKHKSNSKFVDKQINSKNNPTNVAEKIFSSNTTENISFDYQDQWWLVKMKNPFAKDGLDDNIIEWKDTKDVNEKFLLSYFKSIWFYKADDFDLSKDSEKIYQQFDIDITKPLTTNDIKNFTKIFTWWVLYNLKNNNKISSIHKKYLENFEKQITTDPNNLENYKDLIMFLNDNIDVFIQTWFYDFTEKKIKLDNFTNKEENKNQKFKEYLRKNKLII